MGSGKTERQLRSEVLSKVTEERAAMLRLYEIGKAELTPGEDEAIRRILLANEARSDRAIERARIAGHRQYSTWKTAGEVSNGKSGLARVWWSVEYTTNADSNGEYWVRWDVSGTEAIVMGARLPQRIEHEEKPFRRRAAAKQFAENKLTKLTVQYADKPKREAKTPTK